MSWIGISNGRRVLQAPDVADPDTLLPVGTLVVEVPFCATLKSPQVALDLNRQLEWPRRVTMTIGADGDLVVACQTGTSVTNTVVEFAKPDPEAELRITMSWHAPERLGLISVEDLDSGELTQQVFERPMPWTQSDVAALVTGHECTIDPGVTVLAVSDAIEPVGLTGGFCAGTVVDTEDGPRAVEDLQPGDIVQTSEHGMQPIRRIASYEVPSAGHFAPIALKAPFFGLTRDLIVARDHRLLVEGVDAEYLFGADEVLVAAHYLKHLTAPLLQSRPPTVRYVQVLLDAHVCLSVGGAWGESFYLGDLADDPTRLATSTLAHVPKQELPRHASISNRQLKGYEAIVLVSALCA